MKIHLAAASIAALWLAMLGPAGASAQVAAQDQNASRSSHPMEQLEKTMPPGESQQANTYRAKELSQQMVPAQAAIDRTLDARMDQSGKQFQAKLASGVTLKNGTKLPAGTVLMGHVAEDDSNQNAKAKIALCIDKAQTPQGETVPVKADIVGIFPRHTTNVQAVPVTPGEQVPNPWHPGVTQVDEADVVPGVDLHSSVGSRNSAVLVSLKKDTVKLKAGYELALAIAPAGDQNEQDRNNSGGSR